MVNYLYFMDFREVERLICGFIVRKGSRQDMNQFCELKHPAASLGSPLPLKKMGMKA